MLLASASRDPRLAPGANLCPTYLSRSTDVPSAGTFHLPNSGLCAVEGSTGHAGRSIGSRDLVPSNAAVSRVCQSDAPYGMSRISSNNTDSAGHFLLQLHFLALVDLPVAGWFERSREYEFFVRAGNSAKRVRPRIPAPPTEFTAGEYGDDIKVENLIPAGKRFTRVNERVALKLDDRAEFLNIDIWEETVGVFDLTAAKVPNKNLLGRCCVPLDPKFNRRPCTWAIVGKRPNLEASPVDVGFVTCRFFLASTPGPVRRLRVVPQSVTATEVKLTWDPPDLDGGTPLQGYRIEAREAAAGCAADHFFFEEPRTASAPVTSVPSVTIHRLRGNAGYNFHVWAVSEVGPGVVSDVYAITGAVAPGVCGTPHAFDPSGRDADPLPHVAWMPPTEDGGTAIVAYRVWLRPIFCDNFGVVFPADGWIDLGLFEHRGVRYEMQLAPLKMNALPRCTGCLCCVAALNGAGHLGPSTPEAPVFMNKEQSPQHAIYELPPSGQTSAAGSPVPTASAAACDGTSARCRFRNQLGAGVQRSTALWAEAQAVSTGSSVDVPRSAIATPFPGGRLEDGDATTRQSSVQRLAAVPSSFGTDVRFPWDLPVVDDPFCVRSVVASSGAQRAHAHHESAAC